MQLDDQSFPFAIGEPAIEVHRAHHTDRKAEERPRSSASTDIEGLGGPRYRVRRDADLATDRLQIGEGQALFAGHVRLRARRAFRGGAKDRRYLFVVVSPIRHVNKYRWTRSTVANEGDGRAGPWSAVSPVPPPQHHASPRSAVASHSRIAGGATL